MVLGGREVDAGDRRAPCPEAVDAQRHLGSVQLGGRAEVAHLPAPPVRPAALEEVAVASALVEVHLRLVRRTAVLRGEVGRQHVQVAVL